MKPTLVLRRYDGLTCVESQTLAGAGTCSFSGATWRVAFEHGGDGTRVTATVIEGEAAQVQLSLEFVPESWSRDVYLMLPAAAYNGNRFKARRTPYPPKPVLLEDRQEEPDLVINDVPRLNATDDAFSQIHITTGDETTPCICWFNPAEEKACILLTEQGNQWGNFGVRVTESDDRRSAVCALESPPMRQTVYSNCRTDNPSWDRAVDLKMGGCMEIPYQMYLFPATSVQELYARFAEVRKELTGPVSLSHCLPFSASWQIQERKLNRDNWNDRYGYYAVGTRNCWEGDNHNVGQDWQPGWTGGGIYTLPLLVLGDEVSQSRSLKNLAFMFTTAQAESGLLYGLHHQGKFYDDTFHHETQNEWVMIRKNTDVLYFVLKHLIYLRKRGNALPSGVVDGVRKLADCLQGIFERYGQFGQFFDVNTAKLLVGGTLSGALGSGALALAGQFFGEETYIETAKQAARHDYETHIRAGLTTGGPGEILQAPDSESAFAMLESLIVLYEVTGDRNWLPPAVETADQCMTWCASYDYAFPPESCFGKLDMRAAGSVWANVQNKHSSPGICTFSGDSLLKLFRATGEMRFLELITEIAHNLGQYMCRTGHQVGDPAIMKEGWICERVNFSDWEGRDNVGGNLFGSCWPEASLALTTLEVPGLYVQTDTGVVQSLDHIDASILEQKEDGVLLDLENPTAFDAEVSVLAETSERARTVALGTMEAFSLPRVFVPAGENVQVFCSLRGELREELGA